MRPLAARLKPGPTQKLFVKPVLDPSARKEREPQDDKGIELSFIRPSIMISGHFGPRFHFWQRRREAGHPLKPGVYAALDGPAEAEPYPKPICETSSESFAALRMTSFAQDQVIIRQFDIPDCANSVFQNSVQIPLTFTIRRERVVMAVQQQRGSGREPRECCENYSAGL